MVFFAGVFDEFVETLFADRTGVFGLNRRKITWLHSRMQWWQKRWRQGSVEAVCLIFERQMGQESGAEGLGFSIEQLYNYLERLM